MHKVACSLVFQTFESSDALSLGLSSLIVKLHQIALSSLLLCFQTIAAHNPMFYSSLVKWKMNQHLSLYCFLPATPNSLPTKENFRLVRTWGCFQRYDALFSSLILQLILSHGDLIWISELPSFNLRHITRHVHSVTMMAFVFAPATGWPNRCFKISSSVCSSIQNIFISVLLHPKGNVNYFLDWLKLIKLQQVKENSVLLFEKRSRSMLALNMDLHTVWRRLFTWHTMRVRHFCVYCRFKSGSFSVLIS